MEEQTNVRMKFSGKIGEENIINSLINEYLESFSKGNLLVSFKILKSLKSFLSPYKEIYLNDFKFIENEIDECNDLVKTLHNYKIVGKPYGNIIVEIENKCNIIFEKINDILGKLGYRSTPKVDISLIPNFFADVKQIYYKKYQIAIESELAKKEMELLKESQYASITELIGEENTEELIDTLGENAIEIINKTNELRQKIKQEIEEMMGISLEEYFNQQNTTTTTPETTPTNSESEKGNEPIDDKWSISEEELTQKIEKNKSILKNALAGLKEIKEDKENEEDYEQKKDNSKKSQKTQQKKDIVFDVDDDLILDEVDL